MTETGDQPKKPSKLLKWAKELLGIIVIVTVVSFVMNIYYSSSMPEGQAPNIEAFTIDGKRIDVNEMSNDGPVIVYFWATWCGACKLVSPSIDYFDKHYPVVSVALSSGSNERIQQYMTAKEHQFEVINDHNGQFSREWGIQVTPTIVIINDGEIKSITTGVTTPIGIWLRALFA
ncbi:protein disulfide oxidoreductase [Vibrio sp. SCSIO 43135]|uniref:protein disulfide oxidoreductase n=1 Tax=Vibrio sp. SCSIO 43135 TaxID=2819096 RepID=UPI0020754B13|nr:protein disulfide oxidoreductase [Vibrio sp. SCSIO 43135]USD43683.1 protein disulfide oxidoreductase [Vibrio sp. SCSIO 43135]